VYGPRGGFALLVGHLRRCWRWPGDLRRGLWGLAAGRLAIRIFPVGYYLWPAGPGHRQGGPARGYWSSAPARGGGGWCPVGVVRADG
jgi:hypothetical protein